MTKTYARFELTDGVTTIDLLSNVVGFNLVDWTPAIVQPKNGGIWLDNPLLSGRRLAIRKDANIIDTFTFNISGRSQADLAIAVSGLFRLLQQSTDYWTNPALGVNPSSGNGIRQVYLLVQAKEEIAPRYAAVIDFSIPSDGNPFFGSTLGVSPALEGFVVTIEHGLWMSSPPGVRTCLPIAADESDLSFRWEDVPYLTSLDAHDIQVNLTDGTVSLSSGTGYIGNYLGKAYGSGYLFTGVVAAPGASVNLKTFLGAQMNWGLYGPFGNYRFRITGQLSPNPAVFSTYADYMARPRTNAEIIITNADYGERLTLSQVLWTVEDLSEILEEIFAQPGWVSGNSVALFIEDIGCEENVYWPATFEPASGQHSVLRLYLDASYPVEIPATCQQNEIFISNRLSTTNVNSIFVWDNSGTSWSANLAGTPLPWTLLPVNPQALDAVYFGGHGYYASRYTLGGDVVFHLTTPGNITGVWEYWNGVIWLAIPQVVDLSNMLKNPGTSLLMFTAPSDWTTTIINGITEYWFRFRVTAVPVPAVRPVQGSYPIYRTQKPYIDVDVTNVGQSANAIRTRLDLVPVGGTTTYPKFGVDEIWIGARSLARGANFLANISLGTMGLPVDGSIVSFSGANTALANWTLGPDGGGQFMRFQSVGTGSASRARVEIASSILQEYRGTFRAFLRRYNASGAAGMKWRIVLGRTSISYFQGPWVQDTNNGGWDVIDLGLITIPPYADVSTNESVYPLRIDIEGDVITHPVDCYFGDLILLPADEWIGHIRQRVDAAHTTFVPGNNDTLIRLDGLDENNPNRAVVLQNNGVAYAPLYESSGPLLFDAKRIKRYWFLTGVYMAGTTGYRRFWNPEQVLAVQAYYGAYYVSLRV